VSLKENPNAQPYRPHSMDRQPHGGLGSGRDVELACRHVRRVLPKRAAEHADGTISPEELIAAAHSSCYAMSLAAGIARVGGTPHALDVTAVVTVGRDPAGGPSLTTSALTVRAEVDGLDVDAFAKVAQEAKWS
jgi:organic hydroperoxide reductase OsmC/OhrA